MQSGFLSEQLDVERGCRHVGDPVAPYLLIICAEILAIIKQNKDIKGIVINDKDHKISQYADDTSLTLDGSSESLFYK